MLKIKSGQIFETIVQNITEPVLLIDKNFNILWANKAFQKQTEYKIEEIIGNKCHMLTHRSETACHLPDHLCPIEEVKKTGKTATVTHTHFDKKGKELFVEIMVYPVKDKKGRITQFVYIYRDITERKQAEEELHKLTGELKRSNEDLRQFAYVASHDLQAPLRSIEGFIRLLVKKYTGRFDGDADEYIHFIKDGVRDMQMLISDLLEFSKVGTDNSAFTPTDISSCLKQAISNLTSVIADKKAVITHAKRFPTVLGRAAQLTSLFQNLIGNAIKFCTVQPKIRISAKREHKYWVFSLQDNGIGIDPVDFDRIFVPFGRLHSKSDVPGTGIGLATCNKIVERHGGRIWLKSTPGKGSTFFFTLPAID
jgi:PAS domain S-box-containing protein